MSSVRSIFRCLFCLILAFALNDFTATGLQNSGYQLPGSQLAAQEIRTPVEQTQEDGAEATAEQAEADEPKLNFEHFLRVKYDADLDPLAMETSVTRYIKVLENGETLFVDLIGVVHIGEQEYYEQLNSDFEKYDALLYELVAPEGTRIPRGGAREAGFNPLAIMQNGMKDMLDLEFQLEHIDYTKNNLVHADMSPEEFVESMEKNEESFLKMALKAIGQGIAMQGKSNTSDADIIMAMMSRDPALKLRRIMAVQMQDIESGMVVFNGKDGSTIINHRNKKAFEILDREIEDGKRSIGVFYGAGHLPDICLLYTSPSPRDRTRSRMPSSA